MNGWDRFTERPQGQRTAKEIAESPEYRKRRTRCELPPKGRALPPSGWERLVAAIEMAEDRLAKMKVTIRGREVWSGWWDGAECPTCHADKAPHYDFDAAMLRLGQMTVLELMGCGGGHIDIPKVSRPKRGDDW